MTEATRVALLSDVHGNAVALRAVLGELVCEYPDLLVFGGDLTWGPQPMETYALAAELETPAVYIRGNAERALLDAAAAVESRTGDTLRPRERGMGARHSAEGTAWVATFVEAATVTVSGLGSVLFCHGSLRSDEELVTFETPEPRMKALLEGVKADVLVTAHTHIQFDRTVAGIRSVNPGSIGMPYEGRSGTAYWAILGPDVDLRRTDYDVHEAVRQYRATDDPLTEQMVELLLEPPTAVEVVADAEAREFAG